MSGDTGQLQRLSDEQVNARLAAYNAGGALERDVALLREHVADLVTAEIAAEYGHERADRFAPVYSSKIDAAWIQHLAEYGRRIYADNMSVPAYMAEHSGIAARVINRICERFADDPAKLAECVSAFNRIETSMCGPHRQTVRWGESGRVLVSAMAGRLRRTLH